MVNGRYEETKKKNLEKKISKDNNPWAFKMSSLKMDNSGEITKSHNATDFCPKCNDANILPMRMPGFTLYECFKCHYKWRDAFNKAGPVLRPKGWRAIAKQIGSNSSWGRIII